MASFTVCETYRAPVDRVFGVFTDLAHIAEHVSGILKVEIAKEGAIGVGTKFRETRKMFGKECTEEMEITEFEPGRSYVVVCDSCGCMMRSTFLFTQDRDISRVEMTMNCKPRTFMAKVMTTVMGPMMRKSMLKCMRSDFEDMRHVIEQRDEVAAETA